MKNRNSGYTNFDQLPLVMDVNQVAEILEIGKTTAYELLRSGAIPSLRIGNRGQFRVSKKDLQAYLEQEKTSMF